MRDKKVGFSLGAGFKLSPDGKIVADSAASDAKLDLCTRLKRRSSKKIRVKRVTK
jgi:hypothetical protein